MTPTLTVLTVSTLPWYAWRFIRLARNIAEGLGAEHVLAADLGGMPTIRADALRALGEGDGPGTRTVFVDSGGAGYLEACLNQAIDRCNGEYIFRLDDDERASPALAMWLREWLGDANAEPQYTFPRAALWPDEAHWANEPEVWPDAQARLATRELSRRSYVHEQWCGDEVFVKAPIIHHSYLVKTAAEHEAIAAVYRRERPDAPYWMPNDATRTVAW